MLGYIVVENGGLLRANRFLVPVDTVHWISWDTRRIRVSLGREGIEIPSASGPASSAHVASCGNRHPHAPRQPSPASH